MAGEWRKRRESTSDVLKKNELVGKVGKFDSEQSEIKHFQRF